MFTVLLVEDSVVDAQRITDCLSRQGAAVFGAGSSEEAQLRLMQQRPDLIVLDIVLPGQSGFEFCRRLKENPNTRNIPVVMYSARNSVLDRQWGLMNGADDYITKPVSEITLIQAISKFI